MSAKRQDRQLAQYLKVNVDAVKEGLESDCEKERESSKDMIKKLNKQRIEALGMYLIPGGKYDE